MLRLVNENGIELNTSVNTEEIPSVLTQTKAHSSRSARYSLVKTSDVIKVFEDAGFQWKMIKEEKSRKPEYRGFGTHLLCFEHPELSLGNELGDLRPRLYFRNSYHGRTRMLLNLGILRLVCMNGLMLGFSYESINRKHIGLTQNDVQEILETMRKKYSEEVVPMILTLKSTEMPIQEQLKFAEMALRERMSSNKAFVHGEHEKLLTVIRPEDEGNSYWHVFNRVQENLGLNFRRSPVSVSYTFEVKDEKDNVSYKERKIQGLSGIGNVTHLNRFLFDGIIGFLPDQNKAIKKVA